MIDSMTTEEWEMTLGRHLRDLRLRQNVDQRRLAEQAGVALNVVKNLETGKGATVTSLVKVLRALGRADLDGLSGARGLHQPFADAESQAFAAAGFTR